MVALYAFTRLLKEIEKEKNKFIVKKMLVLLYFLRINCVS